MTGTTPETTTTARPSTLPHWVRRVGVFSWLLIGFIAAVAIVAVLLSATSAVTTPVIIAICLAIVFDPAVRWLVDRGAPPALGSIVVLAGLVAGGGTAVYLAAAAVVDQADSLRSSLDEATERIRTWLEDTPVDPGLVDQVSEAVADSGPRLVTGLASDVASVLNSATGVLSGIALALIVLYYLLKEGPARTISGPTSESSSLRARIAEDGVRDVRGYFGGQTAIALMNGAVIGLAALALGVPAAATIAVVNFVGAYVPYLGGLLGGAVAVLLALGDGGIGPAIAILAVALFVNLGLENLLQPVLIGSSLNLGSLTVLLVTTVGGMLAGMIGLVLAAPLWALVVDIRRELTRSGVSDEPEP